MKQISCIIIDDEPYAHNILKDYVNKVPYLILEGVFTNPIEALVEVKNKNIDLLFLDINMPELSGIDLIKMLPANIEVIITSAYSEFAVAGFENNVLDYLLKPYSFDRFLNATQKVLDKLMLHSLKKDQEAKNNPFKAGAFYLKTDRGRIVRVNFEDILYIEGLKNYCSVFTDTQRHISLVSMKSLVDGLPEDEFIRTHKSYIIAIKKIKAVDGNMILFENIEEKVPIGVTYRDNFFYMLNKTLYK
jgi:DNA-binding LytR/AlgR family response regulator